MNLSDYIDVEKIELELEKLDRESQDLRRKQALVRVRRHRLKKLLAAVKEKAPE